MRASASDSTVNVEVKLSQALPKIEIENLTKRNTFKSGRGQTGTSTITMSISVWYFHIECGAMNWASDVLVRHSGS